MNWPPLFLTVSEVLEIHALQVRLFGGDPGVLNRGLLESAIAQPQFAFAGEFVHPDLPTMAAAYLFQIANNDPFADGNKRTATHAALTFLRLNGIKLQLDVDHTEQTVIAVASGSMTKEQLAEFFRDRIAEATL